MRGLDGNFANFTDLWSGINSVLQGKLGNGGSDGMRVVTSGLKAGDLVVVDGLQRVRPGAPVQPIAANLAGPADRAVNTQ